MTTMQWRRTGAVFAAIAAIADVVVGTTVSASAANHAKLKVAFVTAGSISASGWDGGGYAAFQGLVKTLNASETHLQLVNYDQTVQVLTRLAKAGNNIIIAHSSGYEPGVL